MAQVAMPDVADGLRTQDGERLRALTEGVLANVTEPAGVTAFPTVSMSDAVAVQVAF